MSESESSEGSGGSTTDASRRYWLTNDMMAWGLAGSLIATITLAGVGWLDLQTVPEPIMYLYVFSVGSSVTWAFGKDAIEAWRGGQQ